MFEFDCSDLCHSLRSKLLLTMVHLTAFFISRCWAAFCALFFAVVFSVVGNLLAFMLSSRLFLLGTFLYCCRVCIPFGDALWIL